MPLRRSRGDDMTAPQKVIISICVNCRAADIPLADAPGRRLFEHAADLAAGIEGVAIRPTQCLSVCSRTCSAAISGRGAYTFVFGDLNADRDAAALIAMAKACRSAAHGFVPWKERPENLRKGLVARVPPPDWSPDDGSAPA